MAKKKSRSLGLSQAIDAAGGVARLTERINEIVPKARQLTVQAVSQWERVPGERCLDVEEVTGVSRHVLRPDIFGDPPKKGGKAGKGVSARPKPGVPRSEQRPAAA